MRSYIETIEKMGKSTVLVLATPGLEMDLLPALYDAMEECGSSARLDVVIYCRGGVVNAARRVALLFHSFSPHIRFIVPHYCESSATAAALAAHEIIAGPTASFSPIDPMLQGEPSKCGDPAGAVSAQDVRLLVRMNQDWFGATESEALHQAASVMCANFFPTTLASFYRITLEMQQVCNELLRLSMGDQSQELRSGIVNKLLFGYHSHMFSLTRDDLQGLGLPIQRDMAIEDIAWEVAKELHRSVGGGSRKTEEVSWTNTLIATRATTRLQRIGPQSMAETWEVHDTQ